MGQKERDRLKVLPKWPEGRLRKYVARGRFLLAIGFRQAATSPARTSLLRLLEKLKRLPGICSPQPAALENREVIAGLLIASIRCLVIPIGGVNVVGRRASVRNHKRAAPVEYPI